MPGAFTPTCTKEHLPGYVKQLPQFQSLGYDTVAVLTTNDRFVNIEWAKSVGASDSALKLLSDGDGDLVRLLGLSEDMGFGVGVRSKRFALVLEDGTVTDLLTDDGMVECGTTAADNVLKVLRNKVGSGGGVAGEGDGSDATAALVAAAVLLVGLGVATTGMVDMGSMGDMSNLMDSITNLKP